MAIANQLSTEIAQYIAGMTSNILALSVVSRAWYEDVRPIIYRHVNLLSIQHAITFFACLQQQSSFKDVVETIQISFNLRFPSIREVFDTSPHLDVTNLELTRMGSATYAANADYQREDTLFWNVLAQVSLTFLGIFVSLTHAQHLPTLQRLTRMNVSFCHQDIDFFVRLANRLAAHLPQSLVQLTLKPLCREVPQVRRHNSMQDDTHISLQNCLSYDDQHVIFFWRQSTFALALAQLSHLVYVHLRTPSHVIVPYKSEKRLQRAAKHFIGECVRALTDQHALKELHVTCSFEDNWRLVDGYLTETDPAEVTLHDGHRSEPCAEFLWYWAGGPKHNAASWKLGHDYSPHIKDYFDDDEYNLPFALDYIHHFTPGMCPPDR